MKKVKIFLPECSRAARPPEAVQNAVTQAVDEAGAATFVNVPEREIPDF